MRIVRKPRDTDVTAVEFEIGREEREKSKSALLSHINSSFWDCVEVRVMFAEGVRCAEGDFNSEKCQALLGWSTGNYFSKIVKCHEKKRQ